MCFIWSSVNPNSFINDSSEKSPDVGGCGRFSNNTEELEDEEIENNESNDENDGSNDEDDGSEDEDDGSNDSDKVNVDKKKNNSHFINLN